MNKTIAVCTHGKFGEELINSAKMICGGMENVIAFSLLPGMDPLEYREKIVQYLESNLDTEVLFFVDLYGGTPCNMVSSLLKKYDINIISGVNIAMLIDAYINISSNGDLSVDQLSKNALSVLVDSGVNVKEIINNKSRQKGE